MTTPYLRGHILVKRVGDHVGAYLAKHPECAVLGRSADQAIGKLIIEYGDQLFCSLTSFSESQVLVFGSLEINLEGFEVKSEGEKLDIPSTEWQILRLLVLNSGLTVTYERIIDILNIYNKGVIRTYVCRLRKKLGANGKMITNHKRIGYKFTPS